MSCMHSIKSAEFFQREICFTQTENLPLIHTGLIVLGFSLSLGFGCGLIAGFGEHGRGDVLLFCTAVFGFIWMPDDILGTLLPRKEKD